MCTDMCTNAFRCTSFSIRLVQNVCICKVYKAVCISPRRITYENVCFPLVLYEKESKTTACNVYELPGNAVA